MNILIVGNVLKDVYLNLDSQTESFETDTNGIKWLDLEFNASEHHYFNRSSNYGGAAVTLEVLQKIGLQASISDSDFNLSEDDLTIQSLPSVYRYILISDDNVAYFVPHKFKNTKFTPPSESIDYLYIDRSAKLNQETIQKINTYLDNSPKTKLIIYTHNFRNQDLNSLLQRASLIFLEDHNNSEYHYALQSTQIPDEKIIHISENHLSYLEITENFSTKRPDLFTHLSTFSIASATILGCFILGFSVEYSLKLARANLENAKLNSVLSLPKLQEIAKKLTPNNELELIANNLVLKNKGILAADESGGSIKKKFAQLDIPDTYDNRRDYRNILFTTPSLEKYINGIILFDETARQTTNGQNCVDYLISKRIIPGIKVDQGLAALNELNPELNQSTETYTKGLKDLKNRLNEYYQIGLRFAKWRAAFEIRLSDTGATLTPTTYAIEKNCEILANYAASCQSCGLVPIVEPEVVYDGNYSLTKNAEISSLILDVLFEHLTNHNVNLKACILKTNMILAGKQYKPQSTAEEIGQATADTLKNHVPKELAGVVFLSGGQTPEQATENLATIIKHSPFPWPVTFSFSRALQDPALNTWKGNNSNKEATQSALLERLKANTNVLNSAQQK